MKEAKKSIMDCFCTFTGGPWDGQIALIEERADKITLNKLIAEGKSHPYLVHAYQRVGVTNNFIYNGVESYK